MQCELERMEIAGKMRTNLVTLKQTASTGCNNLKILRWISGGTPKNEMVCLEKSFHASFATSLHES